MNQEHENSRATKIRWTIILVAGAITAFVLVGIYTVRPIVIYNVQAAPASAGQAEVNRTDSAPAASTAESPVLEERSIDLNQAGKEELDQLPGIGPGLAKRIIKYREENGGFLDIEEIQEVSGIGEKTFEKLKDYIFVDNK